MAIMPVRSGPITNNQFSELSVEYNVLNQGYIKFNAKVSSEQGELWVLSMII